MILDRLATVVRPRMELFTRGRSGTSPWPATVVPMVPAGSPRPLVIVVGNDKGGTGKSTVAVHVAVGLMRSGHSVGLLDLDGGQGTATRYLNNRAAHTADAGLDLPTPRHVALKPAPERHLDAAERSERNRFAEAFAELAGVGVVVIDTPGSRAHLSHLAHAAADVLITPLNDSFIDIDVLAQVDVARREVLAPSPYCQMLWAQNERRVASRQQPIDWIVVRNRLAHVGARSSRELTRLLDQLAPRMGFRLGPGLGERVVYRELFHRGLTVLDLPAGRGRGRPGRGATDATASHRHARAEIDALLDVIGRRAVGAAA